MQKGEETSQEQWVNLFQQVMTHIKEAAEKGETRVDLNRDLLPEYVVEQLDKIGVHVSMLPVDLYGRYYEVSWDNTEEKESKQ